MKTTENEIITRFREILRRFEREVYVQTNESCCNGVTLAQCHTLLEIESKNSESVSEVAKTLGLDKSTISRTIDGLVNNGLVDRTIPEDNRRKSSLKLTEAGRRICSEINCKNNEYFSDILSVLSVQEKSNLIDLFEKITDQMIQLRTRPFNR